MIRNNLFISNFKKIICFILTIGVITGACKCLDYLYVEDDEIGRPLWHSFYEQEENIDNLFVGSSHVYCDINPFVLDEISGMNNFDLAVGGMRLNNAYYSIREAARYHKLSNVVLELYYEPMLGDLGTYHSITTIPAAWDSFDYMRWSLNKLEFGLALSEKQQYVNSLWPFTRFRNYLFDTEHIAKTVAYKQSEEYRNYEYLIEDESGRVYFKDKGYGYTSRVMDAMQRRFSINISLSDEVKITSDAEEYLRKIITYCQKNDIPITLIVSPMYELQVLSTGDYDSFLNQIKSIADEYSVPLYDFNLCKKEYLDIQIPELFMDTGHLNTDGAAVFSQFLWTVLSQTEDENAHYFYNSFYEKYTQEEPEVFGVYYYSLGAETAMIVSSNRYESSEFYVEATPYDGDTRVILDYARSNFFTVPADEHGLLDIVVRQIDSKEIQKIQLVY